MPELPEVETVRAVLHERLAGAEIIALRVSKTTFYRAPPAELLERVVGTRVDSFARRGKYLILRTSSTAELIFHLGMSGRLVFGPSGPHTRFQLEAGKDVVSFHDSRRFGRVGCSLPEEMGPEPLEDAFDASYLAGALRGRKAPIKALLMDQAVVAGIGNIYATESLYAAGVRPGRAAGGLRRDELARLAAEIKRILAHAVKLRGSTLDDAAYLDPLGRAGEFQKHVAVYGRKIGRCGHALQATRRMIAGRTSLYCPRCQR